MVNRGVSMPEPKIRDRLVGAWRLTGYEVTADGKTAATMGGTICQPPDPR
jgi:hypothetical protein